jgi:hypothetical protein
VPVFAHGMFGLGLGAATIKDARSPRVRYGWLGLTVLLAYLPDLAEWVLRMAGLELTHSAPASLPVVVLSCAVTWALIRWVGGERSLVILASAALAIFSHLVLDFFDGGIPLWWPFSVASVGPNWFQIDGINRLRIETAMFGSMITMGLLVWMWRSAGAIRASQLSLGFSFLFLSAIASWAKSPWLVLAGAIGVGLTGLVVCRPPLNFHHVWQVVPLLPVLLLAAVHFYIEKERVIGEDYCLREEYAPALVHFNRSARFVSTNGESAVTLYRIAFCHRKLGDEQEAYRLYTRGLKKFPDHTVFKYGLAELFLTAREPDLRRPQEVFHLAELMLVNPGGPNHTWEAASAAKLIARAKRVIAQQQGDVNAAASNATSG